MKRKVIEMIDITNNNRRYYKGRSKDKKEESKRKKHDRRRESDITCFKLGKRDILVNIVTFKRR